MEYIGANIVNFLPSAAQSTRVGGERRRPPRPAASFSERDRALVSAICNRVSRMLGLNDRRGLCEDIEIVQDRCPLNLEALASASDRVFIDELMTILDSTDRETRDLDAAFYSRFKVENLPSRMI